MHASISTDVLIVGAGQAGAHLALQLRKQAFDGSILVVGDEARLPYDRPPLSKAYLMGSIQADQLALRDAADWAAQNVEFRLGCKVEAIDPARASARLADGRTVRFGWCVLATGGAPRRLAVPGADLDGVTTLRTVEDVDRIRAALAAARRLVIVGGGYVGLETAAAARELGHEVTVVEAQARVLERSTSAPVSAFFERLHRAHGVDIRLDAGVEAIEGDGRVETVRLAGGERIAADLVVVGVGIEAEAELARAAGIACDQGVLVDACGRTSAPNVLAVGDCSHYPIACAGGLRRLESVQHAMGSAEIAADVILGRPRPYQDTPTFWSDQFDVRFQSAGLAVDPDDTVIRGAPEGDAFSVVYLKGGRMIAIDAVNRPRDFMAGRALIRDAAAIDRARLADPDVALKSLRLQPAGLDG